MENAAPGRIDAEKVMGILEQHEELIKHKAWTENILRRYETISEENVTAILQEEIGQVFVKVLENAGVFKQDEEGMEAFRRFIASL